jgi:predicted nucleotidyltransferase
MITLAKYLGGSHMYGLNTENSDIDSRSIVANDSISTIVGLERFDQKTINTKDVDDKTIEVRAFLLELKKGTPAYLEALWAPERKFSLMSKAFKEIRQERHHLTEPKTVYKSLRGYMQSQREGIFVLGEKAKKDTARAQSIEKYGFDNKGASHFIRLAEAGLNYFQGGAYIVEPQQPDGYREEAFGLKTRPQDFEPIALGELLDKLDAFLEEAYNRHRLNHKFDDELANKLLVSVYTPTLLNGILDTLSDKIG